MSAHCKAIRILIVEDEPQFAEIAQELVQPILRRFPDSSVTIVQTIEATLMALAETPTPDVILLDLVLPPMGMEETLTYLDELEEKAAVVILTGHKEELVRRFMGARQTPVVEKTKAIQNPTWFHGIIDATVRRFQDYKWGPCRENLRTLKAIPHAPP